jgi:hypothetical protein
VVEFLLHGLAEHLDLELLAFLVLEDIRTVVGVLEDELELSNVAGLLELGVLGIEKETLAHGTNQRLWVPIVDVRVKHLELHLWCVITK